MPWIMSSYRSCMMPRIPMRDRHAVMTFLQNGLLEVTAGQRGWSALAVLGGVALMQRIDLVGGQRGGRPERAGHVHGPGHVLAHDCGLDRGPGGGADGEDAVAAHQDGGRAVPGQRG